MRKLTDKMEVELRRLEVVAHKYGTMLVSNGLKNCKRQPIINLLLITSEGTVFNDCIDTKGQKKDAEFIAKFIETGVHERIPAYLQGTESVVVMDGACKRALTLLEQRFTNLIAVPCANLIAVPEWNYKLEEQTQKVKHDGMKVKRDPNHLTMDLC